MENATPPVLQPEPRQPSYEQLVRADERVQRSGGWFWWIAGLSVVNTLVTTFGGGVHFVVGLAFTEIVDVVFAQLRPVGYALDVVAIGFFVGIGFLARMGHAWAFVVGALVYLADGCVYGYFGDWFPAAFHAYVLYCIYLGFARLRGLAPAREGGLRQPV